jgi:hypothetical protein
MSYRDDLIQEMQQDGSWDKLMGQQQACFHSALTLTLSRWERGPDKESNT